MTKTEAIAQAFVDARAAGRCLDAYPGDVPPDLEIAYRVQEDALRLGGKTIAGWKIATVRPDWRTTYPSARLSGPVFSEGILLADQGEVVDAPAFEGGFAAVEAEFAFRVARDCTPHYLGQETDPLAILGDLHVAIEIAGSPLAALSDLGPGAVISDHGNNAALIVGPAVDGWRDLPPDALQSDVRINGELVGEGSAAKVPGGLLEAVVFLMQNLAQRGRGLRAGDWISTGATTGVHRIACGDTAQVSFGRFGVIDLRMVPIPRIG